MARFYHGKIRTGLSANRLSITPLEGEPIYTKDTHQLYIGDGVTPGGVPIKAEPTNFSIEFNINNLLFDDTENDGIEITTWQNVVNVISFKKQKNNSVWFNFSIPEFWKNNKDVFIEIQYILDTPDYNKTTKLDLVYYTVKENEVIDYNYPSNSYTYQLLSDTNNVQKYAKKLINTFKIEAGNLTFPTSTLVVCRFRRNGSHTLDNYNGNLLLSRIILKQ